MVGVVVAEHDVVERQQVDAKQGGVVEEQLRRAGVKQQALAVALQIEGQSRFPVQRGADRHRVVDQNRQFHGAFPFLFLCFIISDPASRRNRPPIFLLLSLAAGCLLW